MSGVSCFVTGPAQKVFHMLSLLLAMKQVSSVLSTVGTRIELTNYLLPRMENLPNICRLGALCSKQILEKRGLLSTLVTV